MKGNSLFSLPPGRPSSPSLSAASCLLLPGPGAKAKAKRLLPLAAVCLHRRQRHLSTTTGKRKKSKKNRSEKGHYLIDNSALFACCHAISAPGSSVRTFRAIFIDLRGLFRISHSVARFLFLFLLTHLLLSFRLTELRIEEEEKGGTCAEGLWSRKEGSYSIHTCTQVKVKGNT